MKTTIRYTDPHVGYTVKPDLTKKVPKPTALHGFRMPPEPLAPVDDGNAGRIQREFLDGMYRGMAVKPHPWAERREAVIEEFKDRTLKQETPIGYTQPWEESMRESESELEWLERTQELELPPEWLTMRTNGENAQSLDRLIAFDDDTYTLADLVPDGFVRMEDMVHAHELLGGMRRVERFLKAADELQWHSVRPRRYWLVVNDEGKRGIVPDSRYTSSKEVAEAWDSIKDHLPSVEAIRRAMDYRDNQVTTYRDDQGNVKHAFKPGTFAPREDAEAEALYASLNALEARRSREEEEDEQNDDYMGATPCPNEMCGERVEDCSVCYGSGYIVHELGIDEELHHTPYWHERRANPHIHGKVRRAIERLDADITALRRRNRLATR